MYCEDDNCYDLLGVKADATDKEIKKAYRKLSLQYHPDKNSEPGALEIFKKFANAYEMVGNEERRKEYDYALEHPEMMLYNRYRYYRAEVQTDWRLVVTFFVIVTSICQHLYWKSSYKQAIEHAKSTPIYRNRLRALELEQAQADSSTSKKGAKTKGKGDVAIKKEHTEAAHEALELQLNIVGGFSKPDWKDILVVQLFLFPANCGKYVWWCLLWVMNYQLLKRPYTAEDAMYITGKLIKCPRSIWSTMDEERKQDLVGRELWIPENLVAYKKEQQLAADRGKAGSK
ncbi:hypothetical protein CYMTET_51264, partial [Cymbomonas tetramitiformis]